MITSYEFARTCYQSSKFLLCIVKFNFASWNAVVSRKIVVFHEKLFCITKDCYVPWKIVLYHERLLCIQLNIELCFALVGHRNNL